MEAFFWLRMAVAAFLLAVTGLFTWRTRAHLARTLRYPDALVRYGARTLAGWQVVMWASVLFCVYHLVFWTPPRGQPVAATVFLVLVALFLGIGPYLVHRMGVVDRQLERRDRHLVPLQILILACFLAQEGSVLGGIWRLWHP